MRLLESLVPKCPLVPIERPEITRKTIPRRCYCRKVPRVDTPTFHRVFTIPLIQIKARPKPLGQDRAGHGYDGAADVVIVVDDNAGILI
jgi:hypothetical protein